MTLWDDLTPVAGPESIQRVWTARQPLDVRDGVAWYFSARREIASRVGCPIEVGAAIVAVLSPRCEWSDNVRAAETLTCGGAYRAGLRRNWDKACMIYQRALRRKPWAHLVTGPKVTAFYHALLDDGAPSWVLDSHMFSVHRGYPYRGTVHAREHKVILSDYEAWWAAGRMHRTIAMNLTRPQVQAILWLAWKRRFLPHMR